MDATLRETGALPRVDHLQIGRLRVPAAVADYLLREGLRRMAATDRGEVSAEVGKGARFADGRLTVTYVWSSEIEDRVRTVLLSPADQARLRAYHDRLVETAAKAPERVSLAVLMPPLFQTVLERGAGGDMAVESRAATSSWRSTRPVPVWPRSLRKPPSGRKRRGATSRWPAATTCPGIPGLRGDRRRGR